MRVGLSGTFVHRRGGMTARTTWTVEELVRPSRLRVAVHGMGYEMDEEATLVATGSGTLATFIDTVRPTAIPGRLMVALSSGIMRRDRNTAPRLCEAGASEARAKPTGDVQERLALNFGGSRPD